MNNKIVYGFKLSKKVCTSDSANTPATPKNHARKRTNSGFGVRAS